MSEIVSLRGVPISPPGEPNPSIIEELEELLEAARSGNLTGIAYVAITPANLTTSWAGGCDRHQLVAGVHMLDIRLMQAWLVDRG